MKKTKRSILSSFKKKSKSFQERHGGKMALESRILGGLNLLFEEIVNPENKGKMSKAMILRRDRCAKNKKVRAYVQIQNPNDKNIDNAVHRYCTWGQFNSKNFGIKKRSRKKK